MDLTHYWCVYVQLDVEYDSKHSYITSINIIEPWIRSKIKNCETPQIWILINKNNELNVD